MSRSESGNMSQTLAFLIQCLAFCADTFEAIHDEELQAPEKSMDLFNPDRYVPQPAYLCTTTANIPYPSASFILGTLLGSQHHFHRQQKTGSGILEMASAKVSSRSDSRIRITYCNGFPVLHVYHGFVFNGYGLSRGSFVGCGPTQDQDLNASYLVWQVPKI